MEESASSGPKGRRITKAPCKQCKKESGGTEGLSPGCTASRPGCAWIFGPWNRFYSTLTRRPEGAAENSDSAAPHSGSLQTIIKRLKRSESVFTKIKRFYRNVTEEEQPESGESECNDIILERDPGTDLGQEDHFKTPSREYGGLEANRPIKGPLSTPDAVKRLQESRDSERYGSDGKDEMENDLLDSFSSLSVKMRNEELEKMHDVLKRYRHSETRLTEKLLRNRFKPVEYDYFPQLGDKEHDLWDLKAKIEDDTLEYLKVLFFRRDRGSPYLSVKRYPPEDVQVSVNRARHGSGVLVDRFGIEITTGNISCLFGNNWLNDEIINFYLQMLQEKTSGEDMPSTYFFNTFFFQALSGNDVAGVNYDYKAVARWTRRKKVNVFEKDLLIVPVHVSKVHWALGVVDMRKGWRRIMIFDSLGGSNPLFFKNIKRWLQDEHEDKKKRRIDNIEEWRIPRNYAAEKYAPSQKNSYDCGLFLCQFAKSIALGTGFNFTNETSAYLRNTMGANPDTSPEAGNERSIS